MNGHADCVEVLVQHGAKTDLVNGYGETALQLAEANGHEAAAKFLRDNDAIAGAFSDQAFAFGM